MFPEVFSEDKIDFDQLKQVLGEWVEPGKERFGFAWAGKPISSIEEGALLIYIEKEITPALIDALADANPIQVIYLREGFQGHDELKANAVQTIKTV